MSTIKIKDFSTQICDEESGTIIYNAIEEYLSKNEQVTIDMSDVRTIATFCAKQIFGKLYNSLTPQKFYDRILITNANEDVRMSIREGILDSIS